MFRAANAGHFLITKAQAEMKIGYIKLELE